MKRPLCAFCLFFVTVIAMTMLFAGMPAFSFSEMAGETVWITGKVRDKEQKEDSQVLYLTDVAFCNGEFQEIKQNTEGAKRPGAVCYLENTTHGSVELGSYVCVQGVLQEFSRATNPGEFDAANYYAILGYHFRVQDGVVRKKSTNYSLWEEGLYQLKNKWMEQMRLIFGEDAGILQAMLLGEKGEMDPEVKELYQKNGIAHILAISGLHVSIIGMGIYEGLRKTPLPMGGCIFLSFWVLLNYALMTGLSPSSVRALLMFSFFLLAKWIKRTYDLLTALSFSALVILIWNPYFVFYAGFWLSFLAVAGIAVFVPSLTGRVRGKTKRQEKIGKMIVGNFGITYFTLPVILYYYYETPLYGFLLNLFVVPLMSVLLPIGILATFMADFSLMAGEILAIPGRLILLLYEVLCQIWEKFPHSVFILGQPTLFQMVLFYGITFWIVFRQKKQKWKATFLWMAVSLFLLVFSPLPAPQTEITFLDVGQGDGICIETKEGIVCMVDGGSTDKKSLAEYQIEPFLKSKGIARVDYWFITHPDLDHYSALLMMLKEESNIQIRHLVLPDAANILQDGAELIALAKERNIEIIYMSAGERLEIEDLILLCHHPAAGLFQEDKNAYSLVLSLHYRGFDALFTGDIPGEAEPVLAEEIGSRLESLFPGGEITWEILKVAHHGSGHSSSAVFLEEIRPAYAVISYGEGNRYGHPHEETLERLSLVGSRILTTPEYGAITVEVSGEGSFRLFYWGIGEK